MKGTQIVKGKIKLCLWADDMNVFIQNPRNLPYWKLPRTDTFNKPQGTSSTHKNQSYFYILAICIWKQIFFKMPFTVLQKYQIPRNKYNIIWAGFVCWKSQIDDERKEDLNKYCVHGLKESILWRCQFLKFNSISIKISARFILDIDWFYNAKHYNAKD